MSVDQIDTIDFISTSPELEVVLTISDHLSWGEADHLSLLENKLNTYLQFIESEQLLEAYPEAKGRPVVIQLMVQSEPPQDAFTFLLQAQKVITNGGIRFYWQVISE
ncbi:hypothetical protein K3G63_21815 [Hymenobacter sp. HSC-4F20]|uniref:DUF6572 domain-containing protein n=1 Tax=Hymenobacter sp. HSC-4F20 TaxID=2864135 RepID=UPI001C73B5C4|nr:DUF6572 domain-containing protein [Hymenobacter sp. HSC-4F20]MBX0293097.1 hypothetical protein [Hymenobacter sp. HSC-4F20]